MAPLRFLDSLMVDFRCVIVPQYVFATQADFDERQPNEGVLTRLDNLAGDTLLFAEGLRDYSSQGAKR